MYDYLIDHALKNVWCTPNQDKQSITKPVRLTPAGGSWSTVTILWDQIALPEPGYRFHVYQIGQLHPFFMGLFSSYLKWESLADCCNRQTMIADVYDESGLQYPRFSTYYMVTKNKNLIFAVREPDDNTIPLDFLRPEIYIRVYSNAYFNSTRSTGPGQRVVEVTGERILSSQALIDLRTQYDSYQSLPGSAYCFVNGFKVDAIDLINCKVGDLAEIVYDSSIKAIFDFSIGELKTFVSFLDDSRKYLLHYPGVTDVIDYQDDIDLFLIKKDVNDKYQGIYFHKNQEKAMRMVTHKDYSVDVDIINGFKQYRDDWNDLNDITLRLHVRYSGYDRPLVYENNRIHELYKLNDEDLVGAMLGIDANVDVFKAENLEGDSYAAIMRSPSSCITRQMVLDAYGFNATSKVLADTPKLTVLESNLPTVDVNYGLTNNSTAYEYDSDGFLIAWYNHTQGTKYTATNSTCALVEQITGKTSDQIEEYYNQTPVTLTDGVDYRFYTCGIHNSLPDGNWVDVTGSSKYTVINGVATWLTDSSNTYTLIRGDSINLGYVVNLPLDNGILKFSLDQTVFREGQTVSQVMQIPMGYLDLYLNKKALIEDLDYIVDFPEICIINKEYLVNPESDTQEITVRFTGHCNTDFSRDKRWDTGFIDHGLLSSNNKFDLRDDKVLRITIDGALYQRDELQFGETDAGVTAPDARNGFPYQIRDIVPAIQKYTGQDTYAYREPALAIDQAVSDYLTLKLPQAPFSNPNAIVAQYQVYSPFLSKITMDLVSGVLNDPRLMGEYNDVDTQDILKGYETLLKYDPTQETHPVDASYVILCPHYSVNVVDVNIYQYKLLDRANRLYCNSKVILSHFYRIVGYGL